MSKDQVSELNYAEIEHFVRKGRIERSKAFRSFLTSFGVNGSAVNGDSLSKKLPANN